MHKMKLLLPSALGLGAAAFVAAMSYSTVNAAAALPVFREATFSHPTTINNPWLSLPLGREFEYEGETDEGTEVVEIEISGDTKNVMGVKTLVYRDKVYVDGELVEDTRDYLAQDDSGNVWYFGEDVDNYEAGVLADHDGAWLAGKDGALPGYWLPASPTVGMSYKQEYYEGEAEDEAEVISLHETVTIDLGTFKDCLKTKDTTPLEPDVIEYKYYCKQVGGLVLEENPESDERIELVEHEIEDGGEHEDDDAGEVEDGEEEDEDGENGNPGQPREQERRALMVQLVSLLQQLIALMRYAN